MFTNNPLFGFFLVVSTYLLGVYLNKKTGLIFFNPVLISLLSCVAVLLLLDISYDEFMLGARNLQFFIAPATCVLALSIYRQRTILGQFFIPVVLGCLASAIISISASFILGNLFGLQDVIIKSSVASSVTTPIAMDVTESLGGIISIAILCVVITGIAGAVFSEYLIKLLRIKNPVEMGVAIGASSHVVGTTKAVELGEIQGAMSGVAIGVAGIITVILTMFL